MKLQNGLKPVRPDHRDFDFHKSFGTAIPPTFPTEYNTDANLWQPDQNAMGLPFGCTGFTQASLCEDEDGSKCDPAYIYDHTSPFVRDRGRDIRASLDVIRKNNLREYDTGHVAPGTQRTAYFNIRAI